jgi:hypothetical protein
MAFVEIVTRLENTYKQQLVSINNVCDLGIIAMKGVPVARLNMSSGKDLCYGFKELADAMQFAKQLGDIFKEDVNARIEIDGAKVEENIYPTNEELQANTMKQILETEKFVKSF